MITIIQRVSQASVTVDNEVIARIDSGILALLGVERNDGEAQAQRLMQRLLAYRVFADAQGRMNRSLSDTGGGLLLVPQFTLAADTRSGNRPGFSTAAPPDQGLHWFRRCVEICSAAHPGVEQGRFGADMKVALVNDGPVTFRLRVAPPQG